MPAEDRTVCGEPEPCQLVRTACEPGRPLVQVGRGGLGLALDPQLFKRWPINFRCLLPARRSVDAITGFDQSPLAAGGALDLFVLPATLGRPGFSTFSEVLSWRVGLHRRAPRRRGVGPDGWPATSWPLPAADT